MQNPLIDNLLRDAAEHVRQRRFYTAHRYVAAADRLAQVDRTIPTARRDAIRAARLAVAAAF